MQLICNPNIICIYRVKTDIERVITMSKTKSISDLVIDLQNENESLKKLKKNFDKMLRDEFGYNAEELHEIIKKQEDYENRKTARQGREQTFEHSENV